MWNKRKDEDFTVRPAYQQPSAQDQTEGIPLSTSSSRTDLDSPRGGPATIGKSVVLKGEILSKEDLMVDGEVEGQIVMPENRITIGPNGKVSATVKAREIIVLGTILGDVEAVDRIDIRKDAKLVGNIHTSRIVIEDGAYFKGSIDIVKPEPKPAPAAKPQPAVTGTPAPAASATTSGGSR